MKRFAIANFSAMTAVLLTTSCTPLRPIPAPVVAAGDTVRWKRHQIEGLSIRSENASSYHNMTFGQKGVLLESGGQKDGMSTFPVSGWRLRHGRLFQTNIEGDYYGDEFHLVSIGSDELICRDDLGRKHHWQVTSRPTQ